MNWCRFYDREVTEENCSYDCPQFCCALIDEKRICLNIERV